MQQEIVRLAHGALSEYAANPTDDNACGQDAGPMILAASLLSVDPSLRPTVDVALDRWLAELPEDVEGIGPFGGLGGFIAGLRAAATFSPGVERLHTAVCAKTGDWLSQVEWRSALVAWHDYDFFMGPAGVILAGATRECPSQMFEPAVRHLVSMCESPGLEAFRAGEEIDPRSSFNVGRINTGLGHGLAGVASALHHAANVLDEEQRCLPALRRVCDWLAQESIVDARELITWPPVGADGGPPMAGVDRPQAWCYGTPGVAWTLWDASQTLKDASKRTLAYDAMCSFCRVFDEELYVDWASPSEALSICHGVAGMLAVADAFCRHAELKDAERLRAHLTELLLSRADDIRVLAATDMTILSGASGILSVLVTSIGGDRRWLPQIALR